MQKSTAVFPSFPVTFTGQSLISHAGVSVLTGFMDVDLILSQRTARTPEVEPAPTPGEPTGHTTLPENRQQPPTSRGHKSTAINEHHENRR